MDQLTSSGRRRKLVLMLALVSLLVVLWLRGPDAWAAEFGVVGSYDFLEYWSAARLLWQGSNPYDPAAMLAVERDVGWPDAEPLLMYNPPWTLALVLPVAWLPFVPATLAWLCLQLGLLLASSMLLWRYYAHGDQRLWIGLVVTLAYAPGLFALRMGQISPWLLAGVAGFLVAERGRRDWLAGASLALLMIKPHVSYLFWPVALWWAWRNRRPAILGGLLVSLIVATGVVSIIEPRVVIDYLPVALNPPLDWASCTLGNWLRMLLGIERRWLQYLPALVGASAITIWFLRRRDPWRWNAGASPILLASVITAPYGWSYDGIILLPVVVDLVVRVRRASLPRRAAVLGIWAMSQIALWTQNQLRMNEIWYVWHPFVLLGLYLWATRPSSRHGEHNIAGERE